MSKRYVIEYVCDVCGKKQNDTHAFFDEFLDEAAIKTHEAAYLGGVTKINETDIDICKECFLAFKTWREKQNDNTREG